MLTVWGLLIIVTFMYFILSKRLSAFVALIIIPIIYGAMAGFAPQLGNFMLAGLKSTAPTAVLMMMAVLFFGVLVDTGLFDPIITKILKTVKGDPLKVVVGSALLAIVASLEGEAAVTAVITCTAFVPIYRKLNMNIVYLALVTWMPGCIKSYLPWAGPSARTIVALKLDSNDLFFSAIPIMIIGTLCSLGMAYYLGLKERARLGILQIDDVEMVKMTASITDAESPHKRLKFIWVNFALMVFVMGAILEEVLPTAVCFEVGAALALLINYRGSKEQTDRLFGHAKSVLTVGALVMAAGVFIGILAGAKMTDAIALSLINIIPTSMGEHFAFIVALASGPLSFGLSADGFYFGIMPIFAKVGNVYGISNAEMGRAGLTGIPLHLLSPTVGAIWLLLGMCDITIGDFHKAAIGWFTALTIVFTVTAIVVGGFPV